MRRRSACGRGVNPMMGGGVEAEDHQATALSWDTMTPKGWRAEAHFLGKK
jgi:hypothetical protein